jgi:hypothetical protein
MPKFEYRFDIAAILLASVLAVLNISAAEAARKGGGNTGEFRSPPATDAVPIDEGEGESEEHRCEDDPTCVHLVGGRGGAQGDVSFRGGSGGR